MFKEKTHKKKSEYTHEKRGNTSWIVANGLMLCLLVIDLLKASAGDSLVPINEMSHAAIHNG